MVDTIFNIPGLPEEDPLLERINSIKKKKDDISVIQKIVNHENAKDEEIKLFKELLPIVTELAEKVGTYSKNEIKFVVKEKGNLIIISFIDSFHYVIQLQTYYPNTKKYGSINKSKIILKYYNGGNIYDIENLQKSPSSTTEYIFSVDEGFEYQWYDRNNDTYMLNTQIANMIINKFLDIYEEFLNGQIEELSNRKVIDNDDN